MQQPDPSGDPLPRVQVRRSTRRTKNLSARRQGDTILVDLPAHLSRADEARLVPELVDKLLAKERRGRAPRGDAELRARAQWLARQFIAPAAGELMLPTDVRWVGNQQTRWGSCTPATGEIRLSTALQPMPVWVSDYVILHELAHLVERNHGPRFWALLAGYPQLERARGFLAGWAASRQLEVAED